MIAARRSLVVGGAVAIALATAGGVTALPAAELSVDARAADDACAVEQFTVTVPTALAALQSERAWKHSTGAGVLVAVVDSGIDASNDHLAGAVVGGVNLVGDGGSPLGYTDLDGHGTAIAGEIAARHVDGSGVIGLAPDAQLLSVRVFQSTSDQSVNAGFGPTVERLAAGIRYAVDHGAAVINVSLSDYAEGGALEDAVAYAVANGSLIVASAGNRGTAADKTDGLRYPAAYPGVLGVTAADETGFVNDDSIHGPQVAVAAPGTNVLTSATNAGDCLYAADAASSSFATGYASAAAALVVQAHPDETPAQWAYRLEATAVRNNSDQRDDVSGWGNIQPFNAITLVPSAATRGPESPFADTGNSPVRPITVSVTTEQSSSPMAVTRQAMLYMAIAAATVLGALGVLIVWGRARRQRLSR